LVNSPYYAPTYFPAAYFYSATGTVPSSNPTGLSPYNAPTYFPPAYFYGPSLSVIPVVPPPDPEGPDQAPYAALIALLAGAGIFEDVIFGAATRRSRAGADTYPLAVLTPKGWEEVDDVDPTSIVRRVTFSITVVVKSQGDEAEFDRLDRLSNAIKNVVNGSNLNGTCLPALTRIRAGHYLYTTHNPEQSIDLEGEFSSIIDPQDDGPATS
jgi:hypothetical protein